MTRRTKTKTERPRPPRVTWNHDPTSWDLHIYYEDGREETIAKVSPYHDRRLWDLRRNRGRVLNYIKSLKPKKGSS